jgi:hypothetical protein
MKKVLTSLATLGATAILIAGCGGGSGSSSSGASNTGASSTGSGFPGGAQIQKYTKCLSKHGIDLPKRNGNGNGGFPGGGAPPNGGTFPEGGAPPNGGSLPEGVTPPNGGSLPEGVTPPSGGSGGGFPGLDQSDPKVKKALDACKSLQPSFPGGGNGFPGGAPGGSNGSGGSSGGSTTNGQTN